MFIRKLIIFLVLLSVFAFSQKADEYQVKSAYIEKVTRFISWPEQKNLAQKDTFIIGIVGEDPFGETIHTYFKNQTIKEKTAKIITINSIEEIEKCDLLFISSSEKGKLEKYIKKALKYNVLTVGDTKGFAEQGVNLNLPVHGVHIAIQVNYECLKKAGFKVESTLLAYAELVVCNTIQGGKE